jgi:hypothetical protein
MRRKLQRISKDRVLFLDEVAVRLSEAPTGTIVLPGEQPYVLATDTTSYAKRFDMIACVNGKQTFAPTIYSPKERSDAGVKGINTEMLVDYILSTLGQETAALDNPPLTLVLDRARIHNIERVREAFNERGGHVVYYELMPAMAAKRLSPLDNAIFHDWKERIRKHGPLTLHVTTCSKSWPTSGTTCRPSSSLLITSIVASPATLTWTPADCPASAAHKHDS